MTIPHSDFDVTYVTTLAYFGTTLALASHWERLGVSHHWPPCLTLWWHSSGKDFSLSCMSFWKSCCIPGYRSETYGAQGDHEIHERSQSTWRHIFCTSLQPWFDVVMMKHKSCQHFWQHDCHCRCSAHAADSVMSISNISIYFIYFIISFFHIFQYIQYI